MSRMPPKTTVLKYGTGILCYAAAVAIIYIVRFTHIEMTETELFVNFWWWLIPAFGFFVLGSFIILE